MFFATLLHNARVRLTTRLNCSVNSLVRNVNCIWHLTMYMCFCSFFFVSFIVHCGCVLCMRVCVCVCMGFCLTQVKIDWLVRYKQLFTGVCQYLEICTRYDQSYYYRLIGSCICAFDWQQSRWHWMTLNGYKFEFSPKFALSYFKLIRQVAALSRATLTSTGHCC